MALTQKFISLKMHAIVVDKETNELKIDSNVPIPELNENRSILIKVMASGINRADLLQAAGRYPPPKGASQIIGLEVSGVVVKIYGVSDDKKNICKFKIGDHVMALLSGGGYAQYVAVHESLVMKMVIFKKEKGHDKWILNAGIPEAFITAFQILFKYGDPIKQDNVLIHAGGSGVGTTVTQMAHVLGLNAYITAGSDHKIANAIKLGAKGGVNRHDNEGQWIDKFLEMSEGQGADIILDCVGQSYFKQNKRAIKIDGRWISYGFLSGSQVPLNDINSFDMSFILKKRIKIIGTTLRTRSIDYKSKLIDQFINHMMPFILDGSIFPIIDSIFSVKDAQKAHEYIMNRKNNGKVILSWY